MATGNKLMQEINEQFLICKICLETFKRPKTLVCLHIFCTECLEKHMDAETDRSYRYLLYSRALTCPICRKKTELPNGGVSRLPDNFLVANLTEVLSRRKTTSRIPQCEICQPSAHATSTRQAVSKCLDCSKMLCNHCVDLHLKTKVTREHSLIDIEGEKDIECKIHKDEVVRFYCEPCEMCICVLCTFQEHKDHEVSSFTDGMNKYKHSLDSLVQACKNKIVVLRDRLDLINKCELIIQQAEEQIRDNAIQSISNIRKRERQMLENLHDAYGDDTLEYLKEKRSVSDVMDNLTSTCKLTDIILKDKGVELLLLKKDIQSKLNVYLQRKMISPPDNLDLEVSFIPGKTSFGYLKFSNDCNNEELNIDDLNLQHSYTQTENLMETVMKKEMCTLTERSLMFYDADCSTQTDKSESVEVRESSTGTTSTDDTGVSVVLLESPKRPKPKMVDQETQRPMATSSVEQGTDSPDVNTMTFCPDLSVSYTMTPRIKLVGLAVQTDALPIANKETLTEKLLTSNQSTNTRIIMPVNRSTLTIQKIFGDQETDTTGLVNFQDKMIGTANTITSSESTSTDTTIHVNQATETENVKLADKITWTRKIVFDTKFTNTQPSIVLDIGTNTQYSGEDKAVGTTTVVTSDVCFGSGNVLTCDRAICTDEQLPTAIVHPKEWTEPMGVCDEEISNDSSFNKGFNNSDSANQFESNINNTIITNPSDTECQTDLSIPWSYDLEERCVHEILSHLAHDERRNAYLKYLFNFEQYISQENKVLQSTGVNTSFVHMSNKGTNPEVKEMSDASTSHFIQTVEKATYMPTPVIISTGTSTPVIHTSDKMVVTSPVETRDCFTMAFSRMSHKETETEEPFFATNDKRAITSDSYSFGSDLDPLQMPPTDNSEQKTENNSQYDPKLDATEKEMEGITKSPQDITEKEIEGIMKATQDASIGIPNKVCCDRGASPIQIYYKHRQCSPFTNTTRDQSEMIKPETQEQYTSTCVIELKSTSTTTPRVDFKDSRCSPIRWTSTDRSTSTVQQTLRHVAIGTENKEIKDFGINTSTPTLQDHGCSPIIFAGVDKSVMFQPDQNDKSIETEPDTTEIGTLTDTKETIEKSTHMPNVILLEKETCTPQIHVMHKNISTENMVSADKQTMTSDVAAAYRDLVGPKETEIMKISRGTSTIDAPFSNSVDRGSSPVRTYYRDKSVSVCKADLVEPKDKFQRAGKVNLDSDEVSYTPKLSAIREDSKESSPSDDEISRSFNCGTASGCGSPRIVHRETLLAVTQNSTGTETSSTFSQNGSTQSTSILCTVEAGTSTPPVEMEDKAIATDSVAVQSKMAACINKLKNVKERLSNQQSPEASLRELSPLLSKSADHIIGKIDNTNVTSVQNDMILAGDQPQSASAVRGHVLRSPTKDRLMSSGPERVSRYSDGPTSSAREKLSSRVSSSSSPFRGRVVSPPSARRNLLPEKGRVSSPLRDKSSLLKSRTTAFSPERKIHTHDSPPQSRFLKSKNSQTKSNLETRSEGSESPRGKARKLKLDMSQLLQSSSSSTLDEKPGSPSLRKSRFQSSFPKPSAQSAKEVNMDTSVNSSASSQSSPEMLRAKLAKLPSFFESKGDRLAQNKLRRERLHNENFRDKVLKSPETERRINGRLIKQQSTPPSSPSLGERIARVGRKIRQARDGLLSSPSLQRKSKVTHNDFLNPKKKKVPTATLR